MKKQIYLPLLIVLLVSLVSGVLPVGQPAMVYAAQDFVTLYPTAVTTTSVSPYVDVDWTNPINVGAADDTYAEVADIDGDLYTYRLEATTFGFAIPANATIDGIVVEYERYSDVVQVVDALVVLIKGGTPTVTNRSTGAGWPQSDAITNFGSNVDLWGESWTPDDINLDNFGVAVAVTTSKNNCQAYIDFLRITVYYTPPVPDITNTPTSYPFGTVAESSTTSTGLTYFTVTNNSAFNVNISISAGNMTGGVTWTLSDTATPGTNIYGLNAGTAAVYDTIVTSGGTSFITNLGGSGGTQTWGLQLLAPATFTDSTSKSGTVTLTATQA